MICALRRHFEYLPLLLDVLKSFDWSKSPTTWGTKQSTLSDDYFIVYHLKIICFMSIFVRHMTSKKSIIQFKHTPNFFVRKKDNTPLVTWLGNKSKHTDNQMYYWRMFECIASIGNEILKVTSRLTVCMCALVEK